MKKTILFVNMRRIQREGYASLIAAKNLGYRVVLMTNHSVPDFAQGLVDAVETVDTYNVEESLQAAERLAMAHPIVAVPSWTEVDVVLASRIAERLDLPGIPVSSSHQCRNKYAMLRALQPCADLLPQFRVVRTLEDLMNGIAAIGFPAILKPTGASGSKGIFLLERHTDLESAYDRLVEIAQPSFDPVFNQYGAEFILEEYLDGSEFSVEGLVSGGVVSLLGVTDKWTTNQYHLEYQHIFPSRLPNAVIEQLAMATRRIVKQLNLDFCSFHLEAKWTSKGFKFIEIAARPAGGHISTELIPLSTGISMFENVVRVSLGEQPQTVGSRSLHAGIRFMLADREGVYGGINGVESIMMDPRVERVTQEVSPGTTIVLPPRHFGLQRLVGIVASHPEYQIVQDVLELHASQHHPLWVP